MFLVLGQKQMYFSITVIIILLNVNLHLKKVGLSRCLFPMNLHAALYSGQVFFWMIHNLECGTPFQVKLSCIIAASI